jgi:shikimate dehydrogenase
MAQNRVGVIGWPIAHSLSPVMHNAAFKALSMSDWRYNAIAIPPEEIGPGLERLRRQGYVGVNVTVPHKQAVMNLVQADSKATAIGAVNTVDFRDNSGTNTDLDGFIDDLAAHGVNVSGERVVVLGAGGSARAVVVGLAKAGAEVAVVNRSADRSEKLRNDLLEIGIDQVTTMPLEQATQWCSRLVVNCTPVGMWPKIDESPWPARVPCPDDATVYDLIYRPAKTRLMRQFEAEGGRAISGLGMLVRQGAAALKIWTGVDPPVEAMFDAARKALYEDQ